MKSLAAAIALLAVALVISAWINQRPRHDYFTRSDRFGNLIRTNSSTGKTEIFHAGVWIDTDEPRAVSTFKPPPLNSLDPASDTP